MHDRIKLILKEKGLQSSSFADKIQVSRGTISHILNGRMQNGIRVYNDPSKDTIDKILKTFPDISPAWLFNGTGPMYIYERVVIKQTLPSHPIQPDLFTENQPVESTKQPEEIEYSSKIEVKMPENITDPINIQTVNMSNNISKKIDKIIIFFSDKTFMTFISEDGS